MKLKSIALSTTALIAGMTIASQSNAQVVAKLTAYPATWDQTKVGSALPNGAASGRMIFDEEFTTLHVCSDNTPDCNFYAPIHSKLGTGTLAQANNKAAISLATNCLTLVTINPSSSGVGGTDVNLQTMDSHGHGFSITNGYIEAGVSLPAAHGSHAGFWLLNVQNALGHGEVDFPETYGAGDRVFSSAVHYWPTSNSRFAKSVGVSNYWVPSPTAYAAWHSYGVLLTKSQICTYMDRKEIGCVARLPEMQGGWYALLSVFTDANRKDGYQPAMMRVAHVRAWPGA